MENGIEPVESNRQIFSVLSDFEWNEQRNQVALMLATGYTIKEAADAVGVTDRTVYNWKRSEEFIQEIDRLAVTHGAASKSYRMQLLNRMIRAFIRENGDIELHDESLLDLIKEARMQSEGTRIDLTTIYTALAAESRSVARSGPDRTPEIPGEQPDGTE